MHRVLIFKIPKALATSGSSAQELLDATFLTNIFLMRRLGGGCCFQNQPGGG